MGHISENCPDEGGLSRTVFTDYGIQRPTVDVQVYILKNNLFPKPYTQIIYFYTVKSPTRVHYFAHPSTIISLIKSIFACIP